MQQQEYTILYKLLAKFLFPYHHFPIVQWGLSSETSNGDSTISVTYPITFSVFNVVVPALYSTSGHKQHEGGGGDGITKSDLKGFSFYHGSDIRNCKLYWFAIGK